MLRSLIHLTALRSGVALTVLTSLEPWSVNGAHAQTVVRVKPVAQCEACRAVLTEVATLSDSDFAFDIYHTIVSRDGHGRFFVNGDRGTAVGAYAPNGNFLRRVGINSNGRKEFGDVGAILIDAGDSIHVFDFAQQRQIVYAPSLDKPARSVRVPRFVDALLLPSGRLLVSGSIATSTNAGLPLHLVRADGSIERSFGSDSNSFRSTQASFLARSLAPSRTGTYWVAPWSKYSIEEWTADLRHVKTLLRSVAWFPLGSTWEGLPDVAKPPPVLKDLWQDESGLLWVSIGIARSDWKRTAPQGDERRERSIMSELELAKYLDTIIEVIDPRDGKLLASTRLPGMLGMVGAGPYMWALRRGARGRAEIVILKPELAP